MASSSEERAKMVKPEGMSEEDWQGLRDATSSLERIRGDAKEDVKRFLENPDGWASGEGSPSGLPTILLIAIGRKSGEKRTTPLVFFGNGDDMIVVGSLAGYDEHPAWVLNVNANPDCWVQRDRDVLTCKAAHLTDEERAELWPQMVEMFPPWGYFQDQTDRPFALVKLTPTGKA